MSQLTGISKSNTDWPSSKVCSQCKLDKPLTDFYKSPNGKFGTNSWCIPCDKIRYLRRRSGDPYYKPRKFGNTKVCKTCNVEKLKSYFHNHEGTFDRKAQSCKSCVKKSKKEYNDSHREENSWSGKTYRKRIRYDCLVAYSQDPPSCACCNENYLEFLALDHINNDGNKHRKETGKRGTGMYKYLKERGYPPGFQILCHNCNSSKGLYGYCPHNKK